MAALRAVVFDLDDTLYPEREYVLSGFRTVAAWAEDHFGVLQDNSFASLCELFGGNPRGYVFDRWLEACQIESGPWLTQILRIYRAHVPRINAFPDVLTVLPLLQKRYRLGLLSDGYLDVQGKKLAALKLENFFDAIMFSDQLGRDGWKPSIRPFKAILNRLGVEGGQAVYIGDNPAKDFLGARQLQMWTVRVRRREGLYREAEATSTDYEPQAEIPDLLSLSKVLSRFERNVAETNVVG